MSRLSLVLLLPLSFLFAQAQSVPTVRFQPGFAPLEADGGSQSYLLVTDTGRLSLGKSAGLIIQGGSGRTELQFENGRQAAPIFEEPLPGELNLLLGADPAAWRQGIPIFRTIRIDNIYPGIHLQRTVSAEEIRDVYTLDAQADPRNFRLKLTQRCNSGRLSSVASTMQGLVQSSVAPSQRDGYCDLSFRLPDRPQREPGRYESALPLGIIWGAGGMDAGTSISADNSGNIYVAGYTDSTDLLTASPTQASTGGGVDAFVFKLDKTNSTLIYATYLGGSGDDRASGIVVQASTGIATVVGTTSSSNFPVVSPAQTRNAGGKDAFIARLSASGSSLSYSTYWGGTGYDIANSVALGSDGSIVVVGQTNSTAFPTSSALQATLAGGYDAFVLRMNSSMSVLSSTYYGGKGDDNALSVAFDASLGIHFCGSTSSTDFPTRNAIQTTLRGSMDGMVVSLNAAASQIVYSTYLGGSSGSPTTPEWAQSIAVLADGTAFVAGTTPSKDFPVTTSALWKTFAGGSSDGFITKYSPTGTTMLASTYAGGASDDSLNSLLINSAGDVWAFGATRSTNIPLKDSFQSTKSGDLDGLILRLNAALSDWTTGTYFGGSGADSILGSTLDSGGNVVFTGQTSSFDLPMQVTSNSATATPSNAFIGRIRFAPTMRLSPTTVSGTTSTAVVILEDLNGASDLNSAVVLINSVLNGSYSCAVIFIPSQNLMLLSNDTGTANTVVTFGTSQTASNSQCTIFSAGSSFVASGNTVTLSLKVQFKPGFVGTKNVYGYVDDLTGLNSGTVTMGTWRIPDPAVAPVPANMTPNTGSGLQQTFSININDSNGADDISYAMVMVNNTFSGQNSCFIYFERSSGIVLVATFDSAVWSQTTAGGSGTAQGPICSVAGAQSSAVMNGNTLTLTLPITFVSSFTGQKNFYVTAASNAGVVSSTQILGTWSIANRAPTAVSVTPSSGSGSSGYFAFRANDADGAADIKTMIIMVNNVPNGTNACFIYVDLVVRKILVSTQDANVWSVSDIGGAGSSTSQFCDVSASTATTTVSGTSTTLSLGITFKSPLSGPRNFYLTAFDGAGAASATTQVGTWQVP